MDTFKKRKNKIKRVWTIDNNNMDNINQGSDN